jgi:FMN reductase
MAPILMIAGSPSAPSRSAAVSGYAEGYLQQRYGIEAALLNVRDLDPAELIHGRYDGPSIVPAIQQVATAQAIILITPVYKASYTGVLKTFLDLLPQAAFAEKIVLPIAIGGSPAHMLVIDYAIRPVVGTLGTYHTLQGVYLLDTQIEHRDGVLVRFTAPEAEMRVHNGLDQLAAAFRRLQDDAGGA